MPGTHNSLEIFVTIIWKIHLFSFVLVIKIFYPIELRCKISMMEDARKEKIEGLVDYKKLK